MLRSSWRCLSLVFSPNQEFEGSRQICPKTWGWPLERREVIASINCPLLDFAKCGGRFVRCEEHWSAHRPACGKRCTNRTPVRAVVRQEAASTGDHGDKHCSDLDSKRRG